MNIEKIRTHGYCLDSAGFRGKNATLQACMYGYNFYRLSEDTLSAVPAE